MFDLFFRDSDTLMLRLNSRPSTCAPRQWGRGLLLAALLALLPLTAAAQQGMGVSADTTRVSFDEAVRVALDQNTDLKRAQASVRQSEAQVWSERMDFVPDLRMSTDMQRQYGRNFSQVTGGFTTESTDFFNVSMNSGVTVFNGFENFASLDQAGSQAQADALNLKRTRREVVFTVMQQFITLVENREIMRVRREELSALRQQLKQVREFVQAGSRPVSELYQQQANVAEAEQALLQAQREREVSKTRLIQTLQLNPQGAYNFQVPELPDDTLETEAYNASELIDEAFRNRLDLKVAKAEETAAQQGIRIARSSYYPSISVGGSYGTDWSSRFSIPDPDNPNQRTQPSFTDQLRNNRGGGVSVSLSIPVFSQYQRSTQVQQAKVQAQNAEYALQDQRQQVALQVRQAYLDYRNAEQQLRAANKRLRAARQARTAAQERYNLGAASIVELQNANRDFVNAASQQVRARYNLVFLEKQIDYYVGRLSTDETLFRP